MDMVSEGFVGTLKKSVQEGKVSMATLNTACRRILEAKYKLGLFDNPYKYCDPKRPARDIFTKAHRDAARRIAAESFVLLKNDDVTLIPGTPAEPLLPFNPKGNIAVIGPLAERSCRTRPVSVVGRRTERNDCRKSQYSLCQRQQSDQ